MKIYSLISRALNRVQTSLARKLRERTYRGRGTRLKYLFYPPKSNSDYLIVCFGAFADKGAKYNYLRVLSKYEGARLFILDDFAENHRGNYYLGNDGCFNVESLVIDLINQIIQKDKFGKLIFVGSSKGGYSALNFSFSFPNVFVCIAAPQYYIGTYMNCSIFMPNLKSVLGDKISIAELDERLQHKIFHSNIKPVSVYIHYSTEEHTYKDHIQDLLKDLHMEKIPVEEDVEKYINHMDLVNYFPAYLVHTINRIVEK